MEGDLKWENLSHASKVQEGCFRKPSMHAGKQKPRTKLSFCFSTSRYSLIPLTIPAIYPNAYEGTQQTICRADPILGQVDPIRHASNSLLPISPYTAPNLAQEIKELVSTRARADVQPCGLT